MLTKLDHAPPVSICRREMKVGHFANGMADGLIKRPLSDFTPVDVGDGQSRHKRRASSCQQLEAISQHENDVGLQCFINLAKATDTQPHGLCDTRRGIRRQQHLYLACDSKTIIFNLPISGTELRR